MSTPVSRLGEEHAGWYLVAFTEQLREELVPVQIGARRLMLLRDPQDGGADAGGADAGGAGPDEQACGWTLYDATCPHRGADLSRGGVRRGGAVVCPFHGRRIVLGDAVHPFAVRSYPTLVVGPLVLARLGSGAAGECGVAEALPALLSGRTVVPVLTRDVAVPVDYVVENAFDTEHFSVVHGVPSVRGMSATPSEDGALLVQGEFLTVQDPWAGAASREHLRRLLGARVRQQASTVSGFRATAYSPTLVATVFGSGEATSVIVTGALPTPSGCMVRVAVAGTAGPALDRVAEGARTAIDQDVDVWEHLDPAAPCHLDELDAPVLAFQSFCRLFPGVDDELACAALPTAVVRAL